MATILCIDDESELREEFVDFLMDAGHEVMEAHDGHSGFVAIEGKTPDLILCDISMPGMNGMEFLKLFRQKNPTHATIPFIFLTAYGNSDDVLSGLDSGADEYLVKPINFDILIAKVNSLLRSRDAYEARVMHQSQHDSLTGLPDKVLVMDRLQQVVESAQPDSEGVSTICLGLDNIRKISGVLGQDAGDFILINLAKMLNEISAELCPHSSVARLGDDQFMIILPGIRGGGQQESIIKEMFNAVADQLGPDGQGLNLRSSAGVSEWSGASSNSYNLLSEASLALGAARDEGGGGYSRFRPEMSEHAANNIKIESALFEALNNDEFTLHYQPLVDARTGVDLGAEALLRWTSKDLGSVPPNEFIEIAEQNGIIVDIGSWVIATACEAASAIGKISSNPFRIAINVSPLQFYDTTFVKSIGSILELSGLSPENLELEITERLYLEHSPLTKTALDELNEMGVRLSIDDFGTGYSALSMINRYPFSTVKIDQSFVQNTTNSQRDRDLVKSIVGMAHGQGMEIIAEGIETQSQQEFLSNLGCDVLQGYHLGKPMPADDFLERLSGQSTLIQTAACL